MPLLYDCEWFALQKWVGRVRYDACSLYYMLVILWWKKGKHVHLLDKSQSSSHSPLIYQQARCHPMKHVPERWEMERREKTWQLAAYLIWSCDTIRSAVGSILNRLVNRFKHRMILILEKRKSPRSDCCSGSICMKSSYCTDPRKVPDDRSRQTIITSMANNCWWNVASSVQCSLVVHV